MASKAEPKLGVDDIPAPKPGPEDPQDARVKEELADIQRDHVQHKTAHWKEMAALRRGSYQQDIAERKNYATKIFWLVTVWLVLVFLLLVASGIRQMPFVFVGGYPVPNLLALRFELSDKVLLGIVTGTTVDVIGLFAIVANYLFYKPSQRLRKPKRPARQD